MEILISGILTHCWHFLVYECFNSAHVVILTCLRLTTNLAVFLSTSYSGYIEALREDRSALNFQEEYIN